MNFRFDFKGRGPIVSFNYKGSESAFLAVVLVVAIVLCWLLSWLELLK